MHMINREEYKAKLQSILDDIYPDKETYQRMSYHVIEPKVHVKMLEYVNKRYAPYYEGNIGTLYNENKTLLKACLAELGIN